MCCPRDCVSRHNGGTSGAPLNPLRDDSVLRALSSLRGLRGAPEGPPLCRETLVSRTENVGTVGKNGLMRTCSTPYLVTIFLISNCIRYDNTKRWKIINMMRLNYCCALHKGVLPGILQWKLSFVAKFTISAKTIGTFVAIGMQPCTPPFQLTVNHWLLEVWTWSFHAWCF